MFNLLRFIFSNRRVGENVVAVERRRNLFPYNCKEASRMMTDAIDRFDSAVHSATERRKP